MYYRNDDFLNEGNEEQNLACCPMTCPFYQMYSEELMRQGPGFNLPPGGFGGPGGGPGGPNIPPPPSYTPQRPASGPQALSVSPGSIRPCTYRFVYIWLNNGRSFWAYLTRVDRRSASGWRWNGRRWVYFGIDLRRIAEFKCL